MVIQTWHNDMLYFIGTLLPIIINVGHFYLEYCSHTESYLGDILPIA